MSLVFVEDENGAVFRVCPKTHEQLERAWVPTSRIPGARYMSYTMWAKRRGIESSARPILEVRRRGQRVDDGKYYRRGLAS